MSSSVDLIIKIDPNRSFVGPGLRIYEWVMQGGRYVKGELCLQSSDSQLTDLHCGNDFFKVTVDERKTYDDKYQARLLKFDLASDDTFIIAKQRYEFDNYRDVQFGHLIRKYEKFEGRAQFAGREVDIFLPASKQGPDAEALALMKQFFHSHLKRAHVWRERAGAAFVQLQRDSHDPEFGDLPEGDGVQEVEIGAVCLTDNGEFILSYHAYDVDAVNVYGTLDGPERTEII